jgi:hypothetical protein
MRSWNRLLRRLWHGAGPEPSRVIIGSTGSGKSAGELVDLVRLADSGQHALVLLDAHGPLAEAVVGHWAYRGYESRILYEPLDAVDRVLGFDLLPSPSAPDPAGRRLEAAEIREDLAQAFMNQRSLVTLTDRAWTHEWLMAALSLVLAQPQREPLTAVVDAFRIGSKAYERLLRHCTDPAVAAKFRDAETLKRRNPVQYETLTGPARRLVESVCTSEVVRLRSGGGSFQWGTALRERSLIAFDGGGIRSRDLKRTFFLLTTMHVLHAVRRHFGETRSPLPTILVLEEAGALGLVTPFVLAAFQELRKAGLSVHVISQSCLDFGDTTTFELLLSNAPWQAFYQLLAPADQELAAKVLTNAAFDPKAVQFTRTRSVPEGEALETPWRARMRQVIDPYFKSPSLQEQEFRTRLALLRVGERLVRTRDGVHRERVRLLRPPAVPGGFEAFTREVIARIRSRPIFLAPLADGAPPAAEGRPDAAQRLRDEA